MGGGSEIVAPRIEGNRQRPEIVIRPRLDLAADRGVTTAALSQAIRIATLGDIDQNVAKFSLSDRNIPIRVALDEDAREGLSTNDKLPVAPQRGGSVPRSRVPEYRSGVGPPQNHHTKTVPQKHNARALGPRAGHAQSGKPPP